SSNIIIFTDLSHPEGQVPNQPQNHPIHRQIITEKRSCTLQWKPAHVHILGNEKADELANPELAPNHLTSRLIDANAVASRRLISNNLKYFIPASNSNRTITSITIILRTKHVIKGMKIPTDGQKIHKSLPKTALMFNCLHNMSSIAQQLKPVFSYRPRRPRKFDLRYKAVEVAEATSNWADSTPQARKRRVLRASESDEQRALRLENLRVISPLETRSSESSDHREVRL
ncbi:hypothetical protein TNCV_4884821, partial [Trichonephila clavipes]